MPCLLFVSVMCCVVTSCDFVFLMIRRPPRSTRTDTLFPYTTLFRSFGPKLEVLEIGSSAGLNLLIDRYRFDLGGAGLGPTDSPVTIAPEWRGAQPKVPRIEIVSTYGCDVAPMDAADPAVEARLSAYVWAEKPERLDRLRRAIAMVRARPVRLDKGDAADWVEARLAEPQADGVTRVLMHSVVWQYLPETTADRIRAAMHAAGARATPAPQPAWVAMEPDRATPEPGVSVPWWPGRRTPVRGPPEQAPGSGGGGQRWCG